MLVYLDQNYLSGIVKRKPAFRELEPVLRAAVARGAVAVAESHVHRLESAPRPDLPVLELLHELSRGVALPDRPGPREREIERALRRKLAARHERAPRASDEADLRALALAIPRCRLIGCDSFMAELAGRAALDVRYRCELFGGRRRDVERLTERIARLAAASRGP